MAECINSPLNCCLIILILLLRQSVWMVFNDMQWSSHHWYASASATLQWSRKNPQTDLVSMLKSKDTFVSCKNLSIGTSCLWLPWRKQLHCLCTLDSRQTHLSQCWMSVSCCCWWQSPLVLVVWCYLYFLFVSYWWYLRLFGCKRSCSAFACSWLLAWRSCVALCENVSWNFCCFPSAFFSYVLCRFVRVKKLAQCRESSAVLDQHFSRMFSVD